MDVQEIITFIFAGTTCWCKPAKEALYFESLHSQEILRVSWEDAHAVAASAATAEEGFEALHEVAEVDSATWEE